MSFMNDIKDLFGIAEPIEDEFQYTPMSTPKTSEDLMISEYILNKRMIEKLTKDNMALRAEAQEATIKLAGMQSEIDRINEVNKQRIKAITEQSDGIIDLHTSMHIIKVGVWSCYNIKGFAKSEAESDDNGVTVLTNLMLMDDAALLKHAKNEMSYSYNGCAIEIKEEDAPYVLSAPDKNGRRVIVFAPNISMSSFVDCHKKPEDARWTSADLKTCEAFAVKTLRSRMRDAIKDLRNNDD